MDHAFDLAHYIRELRTRSSDAYNDVLRELDWLYINPRRLPQEQVDRECARLAKQLSWYTTDLYERVRFVLELISVPETRKTFEAGFAAFDGKLEETSHDEDGDLYSPALSYVSARIVMLESLLPTQATTAEDSKIAVLESILKNTPKIVRDQELEPSKEVTIYKAIGNVLSLYFPHLTPSVSLPKPLKTYKPDLGITDLGVAIEYKFAASEQEVKTAVDGIFSDMQGYAGSSHWRTFYAVIYMTDVFYTHEQLAAHVGASGAHPNWRILLVHGAGSKATKVKDKAPTTSGQGL